MLRNWALFTGLLISCARPALAAGVGGVPFDLDPSSLVSDSVVNAIVKEIGLSFDLKPYEPATPLGTHVGLDIGVEVSLLKVPDAFFEALASSGFGGGMSSASVPFLPTVSLQVHKGMGEFVDVGLGGLALLGNKIIGGDIKIVILKGEEEGPTWAFRFSYTYTDLLLSGINISTKTLTPQLLVSKEIEFADPYLGVAAQYVMGDIDATISGASLAAGAGVPEGTAVPDQSVQKSGSGYGAKLFGGVSFKVPRAGLRLTLGGDYSIAGVSGMGVKVSFTF